MIHNKIKNKIKDLKKYSGTHSPSIDTILSSIPDLQILIDACFLSNPYATELFFDRMKDELIDNNKLLKYLEYYPPQNYEVSKFLSKSISIDPKNIFVGNGAIETIQAIIQRFVKQKLVVIKPTFSSYYEFVRKDTEVVFYQLDKEDNFILNTDHFIDFIRKEKPDSIVIINPNNPDGSYLNTKDLLKIIKELDFLENIIIDESFIHFAYENSKLDQVGLQKYFEQNDKLILVKSMSKDFGIAGIRAGYSIMSQNKVSQLLSNGFLWNVSGLAYYFFKLFSSQNFINKYELIRKKYIEETKFFLGELSSIQAIKVYPSKANFALIELPPNKSSFDVTLDLLIHYGIYVRDCSDKIGLDGNFLRVASRDIDSNKTIIKSFKEYFRE